MTGDIDYDEDCPAIIDVVLNGRTVEVSCGPMYLHSHVHEGSAFADGKVRVDVTWTVLENEPAWERIK